MKTVVYACRIFLVLFLTMVLILPCSSAPKEDSDAGTIKIGAIFAKTGNLSYMGEPQAKTVEMLVENVNAGGGLHGKKIELILKDSEGMPAKAILHTKALIEEGVLAIIGPTTSVETNAVKELCEKNRVILISCAAEQSIVEPVLRYIFKIPPPGLAAIEQIFRTLQKKNIVSIVLLTDTSGFGMYGRKNIEKICKKYGISITAIEKYSPMETDFSALISNLYNKNFQAIVNWSNGPSQSLITKQIRATGIDKLIIQSNAFGNLYYIYAAGPTAEGIIFPCNLLNVADMIPDAYPQKRVIMEYRTMFKNRYNEEVSFFGGHAADAFNILIHVIKNMGLDRESIRNGMENLKGFAGIEGVFNFSSTNHNGLGLDAIHMLTVSGGRFLLYGQDTKHLKDGGDYRPVVTVMDFSLENLSKSEGSLIVDCLTSSLVRSNRFFVLERNQRENLLKEIEVSLSDLVDPSSQIQVGKWLAAKKILVGSIGRVEKKLALTVKLIDIETSVTEASYSKMFNSFQDIYNQADVITQALFK